MFNQALEDELYLSFNTLQKTKREAEERAIESMRIASIQFAALAVTFVCMVGYYFFYGWTMYNRSHDFSTTSTMTSTRIHAPSIDDLRGN